MRVVIVFYVFFIILNSFANCFSSQGLRNVRFSSRRKDHIVKSGNREIQLDGAEKITFSCGLRGMRATKVINSKNPIVVVPAEQSIEVTNNRPPTLRTARNMGEIPVVPTSGF